MAQPVVLLGAGRRDSCDEFPLARIAASRPVVLVDPDPPARAPSVPGRAPRGRPGTGRPRRRRRSAGTRRSIRVGGVLTWSAEHPDHRRADHRPPGVTGPAVPRRPRPAPTPSRYGRCWTGTGCRRPGPGRPGTRGHGGAAGVRRDGRAGRRGPDRRAHPYDPGSAARPQPAAAAGVHAHDGLLLNRFLRQCVERTARALRLTHAVAHITLRLTARGPRVLTVAPHLPGDLIPLLVERATGVDLAAAACRPWPPAAIRT
ncbi:hypothetical protein LT493_04910 [Streptomyces tricolor]|nr:hypothetical protein [Streptomyces tricolor]